VQYAIDMCMCEKEGCTIGVGVIVVVGTVYCSFLFPVRLSNPSSNLYKYYVQNLLSITPQCIVFVWCLMSLGFANQTSHYKYNSMSSLFYFLFLPFADSTHGINGSKSKLEFKIPGRSKCFTSFVHRDKSLSSRMNDPSSNTTSPLLSFFLIVVGQAKNRNCVVMKDTVAGGGTYS